MMARVCDRCKVGQSHSNEGEDQCPPKWFIVTLSKGRDGDFNEEHWYWDICPECAPTVLGELAGTVKMMLAELEEIRHA